MADVFKTPHHCSSNSQWPHPLRPDQVYTSYGMPGRCNGWQRRSNWPKKPPALADQTWPWSFAPKQTALLAKDPGLGHGMQPTSHEGPIIMAGHARQEVRVPDDVYALNVGQDLPGLAELIEAAPAAAGTPDGCGLARRSIFHWTQLG